MYRSLRTLHYSTTTLPSVSLFMPICIYLCLTLFTTYIPNQDSPISTSDRHLCLTTLAYYRTVLPVLDLYWSRTAPVPLPYCSRIAPVLLPYCSRTAPVLLPYCSRTAPVLLLCSLVVSVLDSPAVDPRSNLGSGSALLMSEKSQAVYYISSCHYASRQSALQ